jgi:hypothetical protein
VLRAVKQFESFNALELHVKAKYILDRDFRSLDGPDDDYTGHIMTGRIKLAASVADGVKVAIGTRLDRWLEANRRGTLELGYGDDRTNRVAGFVQVGYNFGGFRAAYHLEHMRKDQQREREADQHWAVWRSKATVEVAW